MTMHQRPAPRRPTNPRPAPEQAGVPVPSWWGKLSFEEQQQYLQEHPASGLTLTAKPEQGGALTTTPAPTGQHHPGEQARQAERYLRRDGQTRQLLEDTDRKAKENKGLMDILKGAFGPPPTPVKVGMTLLFAGLLATSYVAGVVLGGDSPLSAVGTVAKNATDYFAGKLGMGPIFTEEGDIRLDGTETKGTFSAEQRRRLSTSAADKSPSEQMLAMLFAYAQTPEYAKLKGELAVFGSNDITLIAETVGHPTVFLQKLGMLNYAESRLDTWGSTIELVRALAPQEWLNALGMSGMSTYTEHIGTETVRGATWAHVLDVTLPTPGEVVLRLNQTSEHPFVQLAGALRVASTRATPVLTPVGLAAAVTLPDIQVVGESLGLSVETLSLGQKNVLVLRKNSGAVFAASDNDYTYLMLNGKVYADAY